MSPFRRASILKNVAGTYAKEKNVDKAVKTAQEALAILDKAGAEAPELRSDLQAIAALWDGRLSFKTFHYGIALLGGLYWGMSVSSGTLRFVHVEGYHIKPLDAWLVPPALCLLAGFLSVGRFNRITIAGGMALYVTFLLGFALGYGIAKSAP